MNVEIGKQNIITLFWKQGGWAVSFLGTHKSEPDIYIKFWRQFRENHEKRQSAENARFCQKSWKMPRPWPPSWVLWIFQNFMLFSWISQNWPLSSSCLSSCFSYFAAIVARPPSLFSRKQSEGNIILILQYCDRIAANPPVMWQKIRIPILHPCNRRAAF